MSIVRVIAWLIVGLATGGVLWWAVTTAGPSPDNDGPTTRPASAGQPALRIGLVPEHDIFALRNSYKKLTAYLSQKLDRPVELVTFSSYEGVLADFQEKQIDGAFLGSLVGLMAMDRFDARPLARAELADGVSTYHGVIFVREDSPVRSPGEMRGRSIAMLRTTAAGSLFPISVMVQLDLLGSTGQPKMVWMGTHDEVIAAVASGRAEIGAAKDLRLAAYEKANAPQKFRRLAVSPAVPNNGLVLRADVAQSMGPRLAELLGRMEFDPDGREALAALGAVRFVPCQRKEYEPLYEMIESVDAAWSWVGVGGPPPRKSTGETPK